MKTCAAVLFIAEKTGDDPTRPRRDGPGTDAGNVTAGRAPWRQEPRAWGRQI